MDADATDEANESVDLSGLSDYSPEGDGYPSATELEACPMEIVSDTDHSKCKNAEAAQVTTEVEE